MSSEICEFLSQENSQILANFLVKWNYSVTVTVTKHGQSGA